MMAGNSISYLVLLCGVATVGCGSSETAPNADLLVELVHAPERGTPGFTLADQVIVRVVDGDGNPRPGLEVSFAASDGGTVAPERAVSGVDGLAAVTWTPGVLSGPQQVLTARVLSEPALRIPLATESFRVTAIDAGFSFGCGLAAGEVWCWGRDGAPFFDRPDFAPRRVMAGRQVAALAASDGAVCAIDPAGATWCRFWGAQTESQLVGLPPLSAISAGDSYFCGISAVDRTPWCWVRANYGTDIAVQVSPTLRLVSISAGGSGAFGCGLDELGEAWCWGDGGQGQLGDGNATSSTTPVRVAGGLRFREISSGGSQSCGTVDGGSIYCWGTAPFGSGVPPSSLVPTPSGLSGVRVAMGFAGGLATAAGTTALWGAVGYRLYFPQPQILQQLPGLERLALREVSADDSMCGMTADGLAYCSADVFVDTFLYSGPLWLPVPLPDAEPAPTARGGEDGTGAD